MLQVQLRVPQRLTPAVPAVLDQQLTAEMEELEASMVVVELEQPVQVLPVSVHKVR
jgi:hypothetical protein